MARPGWSVTSSGRVCGGWVSLARAKLAWFSTRHALQSHTLGVMVISVLGGCAGYLVAGDALGTVLGAAIAIVGVVLLALTANYLAGTDVWLVRATNGQQAGIAVAYVSATNRRGLRLVSNVRAVPEKTGLGTDLMTDLTRRATADGDNLELDCRTGLHDFYSRFGFSARPRPKDLFTPLYATLNVVAGFTQRLPWAWERQKTQYMIR